jgi:proteasome lid subunit RPN8/RPN11
MSLILSADLVRRLQLSGEEAYPEEGAGLLLGRLEGEQRRVVQLLALPNRSPGSDRRRRYLLDPRDLLEAEDEAERRGLDVLGVFHSHPDHPARPSETDRELALPWYWYVITTIVSGHAGESTAWCLAADERAFEPMAIDVIPAGG